MKKFRLTRIITIWVITTIILCGLGTPPGDTSGSIRELSISLEAGNYQLYVDEEGQTLIEMDQDFGSFSEPGEPLLPGRVFLIALPPGAQVSRVIFNTPDTINLPDSHQILPAKLSISDHQEIGTAEAVWNANFNRAYASDTPFPIRAGEYFGQGQWRGKTIVRIAYQPFMYQATSGRLYFYPIMQATIRYTLTSPGEMAWQEIERLQGDYVLDDIMAHHLINYDQALTWYGDPAFSGLESVASLYDYVIIVENDAVANAVGPLKAWKEELSHRVKVVTLEWILDGYSGVDVAEQVWNFLHDKYPASQWGIRYVLLVGDLRVIPTRRVYYADEGWGLRSDHFFAKLSGGANSATVWNRNGDRRWGELHDDELSLEPDVLVGRIPLDKINEIENAVQAMIRFEQDIGGWKHHALLAGGYNDINSANVKTDNAVLLELINNQLLKPNGWTVTRIYEQSGLGTSTYTPPPDYDTSPENVVAAWNASPHGFTVLTDHGNWNGLSGHIWVNDEMATPNQVDDGELVWSDLFTINNVTSLETAHPSIVALFGCSSLILVTPPWPDPDETMVTPGGYTINTGSELLAKGAAAGVVGFSSPVGYTKGWSSLSNGNLHTFGYYFTQNLVNNRYPLGQALFETKIRYNNNFYNNNYSPFHWAFNLFGDPSMILEGYDLSAKSSNKTVHAGPVYSFGTDNDDNGDMYVAVNTQPIDVDGQIKVYKSSDHGMTWNLWTTVNHTEGIQAIDVLVGRWFQDEFESNFLHVFFTDSGGNVIDVRIDLSNPTNKSWIVVSSEGNGNKLTTIAAARDPTPMPANFTIYLTWEVGSGPICLVKVARSTINGAVWIDQFTFEGVQQPHIDAGPDSHVYLSVIDNSFPNHVRIKTSQDKGVSWDAWTTLTSGDGANYHGAPVVASSTDPVIPTVWVAYNYYDHLVIGGGDLRFAYSTDAGVTWTKNVILSAESGIDELHPDMIGYRSSPNRWMNLAYHRVQPSGTQVIWRWGSGTTPSNWWSSRIVNDNPTHPAMGPQVIYSPGSSATGSGVVYPGSGSPITGLYFAAPWLTSSSSTSSIVFEMPTNDEGVSTQEDHKSVQLLAPDSLTHSCNACQTITNQPGETFRVASLARSPVGILYAASTTREINEVNTGRVFQSADGGISWKPTPDLPGAWWLEELLLIEAETLLVSGARYIPGETGGQFVGVIYRSTNEGGSWLPVAQWPGTTMINTLIQRANGELVAGSGPNGIILRSHDLGQHWELLPTPPNAEQIYSLLETAGGKLFAGGVQTGDEGVVYYLNGEDWEQAGTLPGVKAVYTLVESDGFIYVGVASEDGKGLVFRSSNLGATWELLPPLPECQAVRSLLSDRSGELLVGLDVGDGVFTSSIQRLSSSGDQWEEVALLFMVDAVYDMHTLAGRNIIIATGNTYGLVLSISLVRRGEVYMPIIIK